MNLEIRPEGQSPDSDRYRLHRRFDRMGRLVGDTGMRRLLSSHVLVVGLGGVGSWAAESLARSGVGELSVVDFDEICITNSNRQLHALAGLVGSQKAEVMSERLRKINPQASVRAHVMFYAAATHEAIFERRPDYVVDAIDNLTAKALLLARCREAGIPVVTSTGSGGRLDPTRVKIADLAATELDPLARSLRRILRQKHGFPDTGPFGIPAVFSPEPVSEPVELHYDGGEGFHCVCPQGENSPHSCDQRNLILGSAGFVTGAFGLACASVAVRALLEK
jgi:tRNA A37 threonylcarbamoyladenosine dehydratase